MALLMKWTDPSPKAKFDPLPPLCWLPKGLKSWVRQHRSEVPVARASFAEQQAHQPAHAGRYAEVGGPSIAWPVWCSIWFGLTYLGYSLFVALEALKQ